MHELPYKSETMRWILLKLSEDDYEYATYLLKYLAEVKIIA